MSISGAGYWYGEGNGHSCGYCGNDDTSISSYIYTSFISTSMYNSLIDRGWRRSGSCMYKPSMEKTCCPQYTIRCDALKFRTSRCQKKVIRSCASFLKSSKPGDIPQGKEEVGGGSKSSYDRNRRKVRRLEQQPLKPITTALQLSQSSKKRDFRRLRKLKKIAAARGVEWNTLTVADFQYKDNEKSLAIRLEEIKSSPRFRTKLVPVSSQKGSEFQKTLLASHEVFKKYQTAIHKDEEDECTMEKFKRFLCNPPFTEEDDDLGAYHCQYYIDEKLVAVGVIDILPTCLSSVYLYYDPQYSALTIGTLAALFEVDMTRELYGRHPSIKWYYMGFYLHRCPKMRYKAAFRPSLLLCPRSYTWWPIENCQDMLDKAKYAEFGEGIADEPTVSEVELGTVKVLYQRRLCIYSVYKGLVSEDKYGDFLQTYVTIFGWENVKDFCIIA